MFTIELGAEVKSSISGFKGKVSARAEHMNGCNRYWLQPKVGKDGKLPDGCWFDEKELELTKKPKVKSKPIKTGGFHSKLK
jgi:hypothetical protein